MCPYAFGSTFDYDCVPVCMCVAVLILKSFFIGLDFGRMLYKGYLRSVHSSHQFWHLQRIKS